MRKKTKNKTFDRLQRLLKKKDKNQRAKTNNTEGIKPLKLLFSLYPTSLVWRRFKVLGESQHFLFQRVATNKIGTAAAAAALNGAQRLDILA